MAVDCFNMAIKLYPESSTAYLNRSTAWHNLGEEEKAIDDCVRGLEL